jgi:hypothetical protein
MVLRRAAIAVLALLALASCSDSGTGPPRLAVGRVYMGVSCPRPNSIRCDRVGLAVWLPRRARHLDAWIAGRAVRMRWQSTVDAVDYGATKHRRLEYYEGFLSPAGLIDGPLHIRPDGGRYHWTGAHPRSAEVRLVGHYRGGRAARRTLSVGLPAGWG